MADDVPRFRRRIADDAAKIFIFLAAHNIEHRIDRKRIILLRTRNIKILINKNFASRRLQLTTAFTAATALFSTTCGVATMTPTIKVIPNKHLYVSEPNPSWFGNEGNPASNPAWTNKNWLKSRFHFSFAEYSNPANQDFGVLRVMNDDLVQPRRGFGTHPHRDMEIITYIVNGKLTHQDSMGTKESLGRGSIQFMTAGSGVMHSEFNHDDEPLRFIQTWIIPSGRGLKPNYGSCLGSAEGRKNTFQHLVSNVKDELTSTPVKINQDVDAFASELDLGQKTTMDLPNGRQAYLLCMEGGVKVNGKQLHKYDGCEITGSGGALEIEATDVEKTENGHVAHVLMFTMKAVPGAGRKDV
jgi:redox-sensitive bicupin YhaK (pirin superfamily)